MRSPLNLSFLKSTLLAFGVVTTSFVSTVITQPATAQITAPTTSRSQNIATARYYSDVRAGYWARPFISALSERNIITGFPDGTFKPEQPVSRAEFAAMIQKAFNQNPVRQLNTGGFRDVPADYWAISAIQEAYETRFMSGYPGNFFFPNQQIPKVQAIVALTNGLGLTPDDTASLASYYTDVNAIPNYAADEVAAATRANLIVNYPEVRQLNPLKPLTRAEAAAHLYQALVRQGKLQPLASNVSATNYIVGRAIGGTQAENDVFSIAASNSSFTTFSSLLKTSGLAGILQTPGSFTIFAPTDQAFAALPVETLRQLQLPENRETLIRILRYHVVPRQLTANELSEGEFKTLGDNPVNVQVNTGANQISVNNAQVVQPNIQASNGVIHAINTVLIPPNLTQSQQPNF
ncbi:beta-Ig-H3/fasciclin [Calothrix sp. NIES-4071]|nr:beta-Ig-H3/fasciclin [Calothrix sp. NIES-4071]BAZ55159.1 beta-Ig-H3/fasciclin [Calothrix sp. NIES-4105]